MPLNKETNQTKWGAAYEYLVLIVCKSDPIHSIMARYLYEYVCVCVC